MTKKRLSFFLTVGVLLVCIVLFLIWSGGIFFSGSSEQDRSFSGEQYLTQFQEKGTYELIADKENIKGIVQEITLPETFSWETESVLIDGEKEQKIRCQYHQRGEDRKVVQTDGDGKVLKTVLCVDGVVTVTDGGTGESYESVWSEQFSPAALTQTADLSFFLETSLRNIDKAEVVTYENQQVLYVEYYFPELWQTERHYLSIDYGIPLYSETVYNGAIVAWSKTISFGTAALADEVFS